MLQNCLLIPLFLKRKHADAINADMGGTEMGTGLGKALDSQMPSVPTSLFLLTDGEVSWISIHQTLIPALILS